jgi:heme/copper-type cytochrome/quinol oxidase subunit 1
MEIMAFLGFVILVGSIIIWFNALVDILKSDFEGDNKMVWLLIVIFLFVLGALLYFSIGKSQKIKNI